MTLAAPDGEGERRLRPEAEKRGQGGHGPADPAHPRPARPRPSRRPLPEPAFPRPAAARRHLPGAGLRAAGPSPRRTPHEPGRAAARGGAVVAPPPVLVPGDYNHPGPPTPPTSPT